jgi:hypothetical protein
VRRTRAYLGYSHFPDELETRVPPQQSPQAGPLARVFLVGINKVGQIIVFQFDVFGVSFGLEIEIEMVTIDLCKGVWRSLNG